jgi:hypothetical protein
MKIDHHKNRDDLRAVPGQTITAIVLQEIMARNPKATKSQLRKLYRDAILSDPMLTDAAIRHFFDHETQNVKWGDA